MTNRVVARPLFGRIAIGDVLAGQFIAVVLVVVLRLCGVPLWPAVGVAVPFGPVPLLRFGRRSLAEWVRTAYSYLRDRGYRLGPTVDFRAPGGQAAGLYWDDDRVVAVVEVAPPRGELTSVTTEAFDTTHRLPLGALATLLRQHDIELAGLDIVAHGQRSSAGTPAGEVYEELLGPLPATAVRTVWLAVAFDAAACPEAVARRGGGHEGASRAVTVAAHRIVRLLDQHGCRSRLLTASEIRAAVLQITAGSDPRAIEQRWRFAELGASTSVGAALLPDAISSDLLAKLWVTPSRGTTVAVRLRPGASAASVRVGAGWRSTDSVGPLPRWAVSASGRHRDAMLAHLPIAVSGCESALPTGEYPIAEVDRLQLPSAGCGQLVGTDRGGHGVATRLVGTGIAAVYVAGEVYLAQQIVFRALAIGARVLIRTDRPHAWAHLVEAFANPDRLAMTTDLAASDAGFSATVIDGVAAPTPHAGITTVYLTPDPSGWPTEAPDVSIRQIDGHGEHVVLDTGVARIELELVSIAREAEFIGRPHRWAVQPA